ncbi:MAG TPA: carboxylesterase family protein [Micropepsaceae bacterium]|nr:carboxylesterase family protein [Micropepsaceae bacterium]
MKRYSLAVAACLLIAAPAWAQVPPDIAAAIRKIGHVVDTKNTAKLYAPFFTDMKERYADARVVRDVSYGPDPLNRLDVFTPKSGQPTGRMVVIYAHGGQMLRGDKHEDGSPYYDNLMLFLTQHDMVGVNMDYRLAPKNHWPDAQHDVQSVIRWVKANIGQYGGDPNRIVLWGQSAGAGLIASYLSHPEFYGPDGVGVKGAIIHSGHYNLGKQGSEYYGHDPDALRAESSVQGMTKVTIPLLVSYTEVDIPGAPEEAENLKSTMCGAGRCPTFVEFRDHSHMSQVFSVGTPDVSVSGPVLKFLTGIK